MKTLRVFCTIFIIFVIGISVSFAKDGDGLTAPDVDAFLKISSVLWPLAEEMEDKGIPHYFKVQPMNMVAKNVPSHLKAVENLKRDYPEYYKKTSVIILGFVYGKKEDGVRPYSSVEEWAKIADRVMLAFYTSQSDGAGRKFKDLQEKAAPLIMMSKMNPEATKQMQGMINMLKSFSEVSEEDRVVVRAYEDNLTLHFGSYPKP